MQQVSSAGNFDRIGQLSGVAVVLSHSPQPQQTTGGGESAHLFRSDLLGKGPLLDGQAHGDGLGAVDPVGGTAQAVRGVGFGGHGDGLGLSNEELHSAPIVAKYISRVNIVMEKSFSSIGSRLREERDRMRVTQEQMAETGQVTRRTLTNWERDQQVPSADFLAKIAVEGADVLYVVTGQRLAQVGGIQVKPEELDLLENYRSCGENDQAALRRITRLMASAKG